MSRKMARECAFKLIYELPFHEDKSVEARMEIFGLTQEYASLNQNDLEYLTKTLNNWSNNSVAIDEKLSSSLHNWKIERLSKVNLSILRLAISEIDFDEDIPFQVSINEAIELAKKFSDDDAPSFVNGVLADIIK